VISLPRKIDSWEALEKAIMEDVAESLSKSDELKYKDNDSPTFNLIHALDTEFYQLYNPKVYDPNPKFVTRDAIKSEVKRVGNEVIMEIFHDIDFMQQYAGDDVGGGLKRYVTQKGVNITEKIPDMIEDGSIPPYDITRKGYTEEARKNLDEGDNLYNYIVKRLKEKGWKIE
jgi:hypothetical protein